MVLGLVLVLPLPSARTTVGPQRCSGSHQLGQPWVVPHFIQLNDPRAECHEVWQAHVYLEAGKEDPPISIHGLTYFLLIFCFVSLLSPLWPLYTFLHCTKNFFYTSKSLKRSLQMPKPQQQWGNVLWHSSLGMFFLWLPLSISRGKRDLSIWVLLSVLFPFRGRALTVPSPGVYDLYPSKNMTDKNTHHH